MWHFITSGAIAVAEATINSGRGHDCVETASFLFALGSSCCEISTVACGCFAIKAIFTDHTSLTMFDGAS